MAKTKSIYSVHPVILMTRKWVAALKPKTGRSLDERTAVAKKSGPAAGKELIEWLKKEHGLGSNAACLIAERAEGRGEDVCDPDAYLRSAARYVEQMFDGRKAAMRPIYDEREEGPHHASHPYRGSRRDRQ
jgi:4-aminobutyrate aminotransferase-like enzyme